MFGYVLALLFSDGDYDAVKAFPLPILEVYLQAVKSQTAATIFVAIKLVSIMSNPLPGF